MRKSRFFAIFFACVALLAAIGFLARAPLAGFLAETWLASKGIPSSVHVESIGFDQVRARVSLGSNLVPDFNGHIAAELEWNGLAPHARFVRISEPHVVARFDGKTFSLGALGKLMDALKGPPSAPPSTVSAIIEHAIVHVIAPQGAFDIAANAQVTTGKLTAFDVASRGGTLIASGTRLTITKLSLSGHGNGENFALTGTVEGAYSRAELSVQRFAAHVAAPAMRIGPGAGLSGHIDGVAQADDAVLALKDGALHAQLLHAVFAGKIDGQSLDLHLALDGHAHADPAVARILAARIPVFGADATNVRAVIAALSDMTLKAADLHMTGDSTAMQLSLQQPLLVTSTSGGIFLVRNARLTTGTQDWKGILSASLSGGGLPEIAFDPLAFRKTASGIQSQFDVRAMISAGIYRGAEIAGHGALHTQGLAYDIAFDHCARVGLAAYLSKNRPMLRDLAGAICPRGGPVIRGTPSGWRFAADWRLTSGKLVAAPSAIAQGTGDIAVLGSAKGLESGRVTLARAVIADRAGRFARLNGSGKLTLANQIWSGTIAVTAKDRKLGTVTIRHAMTTGAGNAQIASQMPFSPNGLKPADLSPLLANLSQVSGDAVFNGKVAWTRNGMTSGGTLAFDHLDFVGPMGPVSNANGRIAFTSLVPVRTASGQQITLNKVAWLIPASDVDMRLAIDGTQIDLEQLNAKVAGGTASLDPAMIDLSGGLKLRSTVHLDNIDLDTLIAATNLSNRVKIEARVSGQVPFATGPDGFRIANGALVSIAPGHLSISRSLWAGAGTNDAIRDFAYQAMEHLALDRLDGTLTSLPEGRLGLKLHIHGRNDPPKEQPPTTVDLVDLIQGNAFNKPMPLPKDTPVDLTLDTSLNFDELLRAYGALHNGSAKP